MPSLGSIQHPELVERASEYVKYRWTYEGGRNYVERYLEKFSKRETQSDFARRRRITYNPAFAKAAIEEVKNAIFQRLADVSRRGGPESYSKACLGVGGGVDRASSSMTAFLGKSVLTELLPMGKVGIWVDREPVPGDATLADVKAQPYLYVYKVEDLRSWTIGRTGQFSSVLLCDWDYVTSEERFGLPTGWKESYRYAFIRADGRVQVETHSEGEPVVSILNLTQIPFVLGDIGQSLLKDVVDYQVAMLNMASADVSYAVSSNYPFYVEQRDARNASPHLRPAKQPNASTDPLAGTSDAAQTASTQEVAVGTMGGRTYAQGMEAPSFINPSDIPLRVSMDKQAQMKAEIRELVHLAVSSIGSSAEAKALDNQGLNNGLSAIALELELVERRIGEIWAAYESTEPPTIRYPEVWTMQSDAERREEAKALQDQMDTVPSKTCQKAIAKMVAERLVGHKVTNEVLERIYSEIDSADAVTSKSKDLLADVEQGLVTKATASALRGYPEGESKKAEEEQAKRLAIIAISQSAGAGAARGIPDQSVDPASEVSKERKLAKGDTGPVVTRGEGAQ